MSKADYPQIKFRLNKTLDKRIGLAFLNDGQKAVYDFVAEIIKIHPELKRYFTLNKRDRRKYLFDFIDKFYQENRSELLKSRKEFAEVWQGVNKNFFSLADKYFNNLLWPEGKYICYISIFPIGPRFLETKKFQTCWLWKKNLKGQVIHEMLHFQFYNLVKSLDLEDKDNEQQIWELSEIFNDIIQKGSDFEAIQGYKVGLSYPGLANKYKKYEKIWQKNKNARKFILEALK